MYRCKCGKLLEKFEYNCSSCGKPQYTEPHMPMDAFGKCTTCFEPIGNSAGYCHKCAERRNEEYLNSFGDLKIIGCSSCADKDETIRQLTEEINRRNGDPVTRIHNLCEALEQDQEDSPFTQEEWDRVDEENTQLKNKVRDLRNTIASAIGASELGSQGDAIQNMLDILHEAMEK